MVEQGDILLVEGISFPCVVISRNKYNESGHAVVCPITPKTSATLEYCLSNYISKYVQCDALRMLDLKNRKTSNQGCVSMTDLVNIISRVNSIFDLY